MDLVTNLVFTIRLALQTKEKRPQIANSAGVSVSRGFKG